MNIYFFTAGADYSFSRFLQTHHWKHLFNYVAGGALAKTPLVIMLSLNWQPSKSKVFLQYDIV